MEDSGALLAVDRSQFKEPEWHVPVTPCFRLVQQDMPRAIHGPHAVLHLVDLGEEHVVRAVVPRGLPKVDLGHIRNISSLL